MKEGRNGIEVWGEPALFKGLVVCACMPTRRMRANGRIQNILIALLTVARDAMLSRRLFRQLPA